MRFTAIPCSESGLMRMAETNQIGLTLVQRPRQPLCRKSFYRVAAGSQQMNRTAQRQLPMTFPVLLNPIFQVAAAFVVFFAGFTLFSFCVLCVLIGWALCRCTNRLAVLMARSHSRVLPSTADAAPTNTAARIRHQTVQSRPLPG